MEIECASLGLRKTQLGYGAVMESPGALRARATRLAYLCLVLAGLLLIDWLALPSGPGIELRLAISRWRGAAHGRPVPVTLFRTPGGLRAAFFADSQDPPKSWTPVQGFSLFEDMTRASGSWAPTTQSRRLVLQAQGDLTAAEMATVSSVLLKGIASSGEAEAFESTAELLRQPGWAWQRPLIGGYVHNSVSIAMALGLAVCLILLTREILLARLQGRRMRSGECPFCGYPRQHDERSTCPECGNRSPAGGI